jgi:hypothetical protein
VINIVETCDGGNTSYTVSFTLYEGDPASYAVTGGAGTISGSTFTSDPIVSGVSYNFIADDANSCSPQMVAGMVNCGCNATATISGTATICSGNTATISIALAGTGPWDITYTDGSTPVTVNAIATSPYTFTTGTASSYTVTSVSDANCTGSASGSATITVKSGVTISNLIETGNGSNTEYTVGFTVCGGDPGVHTVTGGAGTISGSTFTSDPISSGSTYTFIVNDVNNCAPQTVSNTVTCACDVTATISGDTTICQDGTATLSIALTGTGPWNVTYNVGAAPTTVIGIVSSPYTFQTNVAGTYTVSAVAGANCTGTVSGSAVVMKRGPSSVSVSNATICPGQSATVTATPSSTGGSYLWSPTASNAQSITVSPSVTTSYTATYTLDGCSVSGSGTVTAGNARATPVITRSNMILTSSLVTGN